MVSHPDKWVDDFAAAGANQFTFHIEAEGDKSELIRRVKAKGMRCGIAVKPKTSVETVFQHIDNDHVDMILIMTVEPGFGGQSFMGDMMEKVRVLRRRYPSLDIEVDGGITTANIDVCAAAGANAIVSGTGVFKAKEGVKEAIDIMRASVQKQIDNKFNQA
jgi:ribulose-phosphate 3-epimerase